MKKVKFYFLFLFVFIFLAACSKSYTITFVTNSSQELEQIVYQAGDELTIDSLSEEGKIFDGWFLDDKFETKFENQEITEDITLYAKWTVKTYTVRFMDGSEELSKVTVEHGKDATAPKDPDKVGFEFEGWDKSFTNITKDTVVFATFKNITFEVKFMNGDEQIGETQVINYGAKATAPADLEKEGYTFIGWDKEFENVTEDLVVNAVFEINTYTVKFTDYNGVLLKTETVEYGEAATAPENPTREGYEFDKWNADFSNVTKNLTVLAQYKVVEYTIEYNDGETKLELTPAKYTIEDEITYPTYTKEGYLFVGWYLNPDFSDEAVTGLAKGETGNVVLYAKTLDASITHEINYTLNEGTWGWTTGTVTEPGKGINAVSNLPEIFMQDFYTYLKDNNLLSSELIEAGLRKTTWADFSKSYEDPVAIYNWASTGQWGGNYAQETGYNRFFFDTGSGNPDTGELYDLVGGFLGTPGYKEKYFTVAQHLTYLLRLKYTAVVNQFWTGTTTTSTGAKQSSEAAGGFVLDGYFYGTQGLLATSDVNHKEFNALRAAIPTPEKGYKWVDDALVAYDYDFLTDSMVAGSEVALTIPSREGYFFAGWYENADFSGDRVYKIAAGNEPAAMYYAKWEAIS